jgi:hypothetical protein
MNKRPIVATNKETEVPPKEHFILIEEKKKNTHKK